MIEEEQITMFRDFSLAPTIAAGYHDPGVETEHKLATELKEPVAQAGSRPVSPVYVQIPQAIYKNVNEALAGRGFPDEAPNNDQTQMQQALETF